MTQRGASVRVRGGDPAGHHRLPRYLRGCVGQVVAVQGTWPNPSRILRADDHSSGVVVSVRFTAAEVFGDGDHRVYADLWEADLEVLHA